MGAISSGLVLGPETLLHDVYKVLPAFACEVRQGSFIVGDPYYQPRATVDTSTTLSDVEDFVAASLRRSIEAYCSGAARVGVFLSGGIDSALLGTELARIEENDGRGVSFGASNWVDEESTAAARVARKLGLPFTQAQVDGSFDALAGLEQAIWHIGEPTMFENAIALEVAAHAVAGDAGALLTGEGGDDFFGAQNLIIARWLPAAWKLPAGLRHGLASALSSAPLDPLSRVGRYLGSDSLEHYLRGAQSWAPGLVARAPDRGVQDRVARLEEDYRGLSSVGSLTVLLLIGYWYPWIERMEQTSAAHGIDALHPFQRDELLQFSLTVPDNLKMRRGGLVLKPALRNLVEQRLGTEEVRGAKKQLAAPFALWLRSSRTLRQAVLDLRRPSARFREFLDPALAAPYLDDFARNGPKDTATRRAVSMLLSFEIWLGQVLDGERPPASFDP
ncbi:MAG: asparagine synthase-related protein [Gaiellales bacterium]